MNEATGGAIRLLICDDHRLLTETLTDVVGHDPGFSLLSPVHSSEQAVELVKDLRPDVVLMDIEFGGA